MTRYLSILSIQRPFPIGVDLNNRNEFSCNYLMVAAATVSDFEGEISKYISDNGLGNTSSILIGRKVSTPTGDGPFIRLIDTGGISPLETHNRDKYERLSMQIVVIAASYVTGRELALSIWRLLDGKFNLILSA